jgi:hypothetical protein
MKRNYRWHLQFSRTPIVFTVAQETVERRRFRGMAPFPRKPKKNEKFLTPKKIHQFTQFFNAKKTLGNFIFSHYP